LGFAAKDARDLGAALKTQEGGLYRGVEIRLLVDEGATKDNILDGLDWLEREVTARDVGVLFLAGHGVNDSRSRYFFLPSEAEAGHLRRTGLLFTDIRVTLSSLVGKALFFVDTCHAGNVIGGKTRGGVDIDAVAAELASAENGTVVFASSTGRQLSLERSEWGNGAFTEALLEGLAGRADYTGDDKITINELDLWLAERVKELTDGQQSPTTAKPVTVPDFPVAVGGN
jgi:uncharacterized caspase-like protein